MIIKLFSFMFKNVIIIMEIENNKLLHSLVLSKT